MQDFSTKFRGRLFGHGGIAVSEHRYDFAAQATLIKVKCGLALTAETNMRIQFHPALLGT
jgi:hypothetical protein